MKKPCFTKGYEKPVIIGALVTILFGICLEVFVADNHSVSMMAGMFTGFGAGILGVAVVLILREKLGNPEKNKMREIEKNDERNIQLTRAAWTVAGIIAMILYAFCGFVFVGLGYTIAGAISIGCMYVVLVIFVVAYKIFEKKM